MFIGPRYKDEKISRKREFLYKEKERKRNKNKQKLIVSIPILLNSVHFSFLDI